MLSGAAMDKTLLENMADIFKALSHPLRVQIVYGLMQNGECNVNKMCEALKVHQPTISQHLNILKYAGIIEGYRKGKQVCYKVVSKHAKIIINSLIDYELLKTDENSGES